MNEHEQDMVTIFITAKELGRYESNSLGLYWTPGASTPYWASGPRFTYDECVATPLDFAKASGYTTVEGIGDPDTPLDEVFTLAVARPAARQA